jgi:acyl-CoA synthetase (AMP-forming)/AMP-acid ligase II
MIQPIFERLNSRVAISSEHAAPVLSNLFDQVVIVTDELMHLLPEGKGPLTSMAAPSDPACVLFLPTSSNEARGVSFSHAALSTALLGQGPAARITPLSRVMQLSSFNHDICVTEIFTTLAYGGCVCIPSAVERLQDFGAAVNRMQVNWSYMTPHLSRKVDPALLTSLKVVCFRTRGLDDDTYNIWHGKVNVILAYGPQDVCPLGIAFLEALGPHHLRSIGRPFVGNLLVVNPDDHGKRVPIGAVGELIVQGPTLAFSYPNRESTMIPMSPLGPAGANVRYFKTGHRVRYTQSGLLEFISGKRDDVDVDGKVVNVTEIEQYLRRCLGQGVDAAVETVIFRGVKNESIITAFIELGDRLTGDEDLASLSPAIKEQLAMAKQLAEVGLKKRFPPSMIPSAFVPVKQLPVSPSLKVNRRRLHKMIAGLSKEDLLSLAVAPNVNDAKLQSLKPLPLTLNEERMRAIWARVLGVEEAKISALHCFFGAGGDEIAAAQLVAACRHEGIQINIADVIRGASLTELCKSMATAESPQTVRQVSPLPQETSQTSPAPAPVNPNMIKQVFIEKVIAPKLGIDPSAIGDAAEASAAQIRYIETGMLRGRANINYLIFNFTGAVDAKKLEEACKTLASIHPILRTAFVAYNRRVYQAVIKSSEIDFRRTYCPTWRLSAQLEKVIKKDQSLPARFETPMTKFMFLDGGKQSVFILRLSKAQYDDLSVALLVKDLKRLYDGSQSPPRRPTYCEFIRCTQIANSNAAEDYWRALLEGAVMTQVVAHSQPYQLSSNIKTIRNPMVPLGSLSSLGISFETVLKGAWAMVLANLSASSDIVFGEVIDGRHVRLPGGHSVAGVMGPTVNVTPVRVQFPETALTPLALLQYIHAQRMSSIPFENLGTLTIVEKCTPWPYWTRFSTLVQHQYEDTAILPSEPKSFHLGAASCKFTISESRSQDIPDLFVRSVLRPPGRVEVMITFCADRIPGPFAEHALKMLGQSISLLTSVSIMQPVIPCGYQYRAMMKRIPLPPSASLSTQGSDSAESKILASLSQEQIKAVQTVINDTWTSILNPRTLGVPEAQVHNAAFYDLWGSLIPASQMTMQLNRDLPKVNVPGADANLKVTMEEIIEHPTMLKQFELIASKLKPQSGKETQKAKEAQKGKEKELDRGAPSPVPSLQSPKKKPSMNVSVPATSLSSRIRRLASTVARTNSPPTSAVKIVPNSPPPATPTSPVAIGLASAMVADLSPLSPRIIGSVQPSPSLSSTLGPPRSPAPAGIAGVAAATVNNNNNNNNNSPIPNAPPQLPNLPAFDPIAEEAEPSDGQPTMALGVSTSPAVLFTPNSSADSMTEGSTASSHHSGEREREAIAGTAASERERGDRDTLGPLPFRAVAVPAGSAAVSPSTPMLNGSGGGGAEEAEDLVSPLSAITPKSGPRSGWMLSVGASSSIGSVVSTPSPVTPQQQSTSRFVGGAGGKSGLSPVVG